MFQAWLASSLIAIALPSIARHLNVNRDASFPFGCFAMPKIKFAALLWQKQFEVFQYIFQASVPLLEEFVNYLSQWIYRTYMYACTQLCLCLRYVMLCFSSSFSLCFKYVLQICMFCVCTCIPSICCPCFIFVLSMLLYFIIVHMFCNVFKVCAALCVSKMCLCFQPKAANSNSLERVACRVGQGLVMKIILVMNTSI